MISKSELLHLCQLETKVFMRSMSIDEGKRILE